MQLVNEAGPEASVADLIRAMNEPLEKGDPLKSKRAEKRVCNGVFNNVQCLDLLILLQKAKLDAIKERRTRHKEKLRKRREAGEKKAADVSKKEVSTVDAKARRPATQKASAKVPTSDTKPAEASQPKDKVEAASAVVPESATTVEQVSKPISSASVPHPAKRDKKPRKRAAPVADVEPNALSEPSPHKKRKAEFIAPSKEDILVGKKLAKKSKVAASATSEAKTAARTAGAKASMKRSKAS